MKKTISVILLSSIFTTLFSDVSYANVIWPAIYVVGSHFRFWYLALATILIEAYLISRYMIAGFKKALLISSVANIFSATIGLYLLAFGMIGWHFVVDNFVGGTFHVFNKILTIILMFLLSALLESLIVRLIWKYNIKKTFGILLVGNLLSYSFITADLFYYGGWDRSY